MTRSPKIGAANGMERCRRARAGIACFGMVALMSIMAPRPASANCTGSIIALVFGTVDLSSGAAVDTTGSFFYSSCGSIGTTKRNCSSIGAGTHADGTSRRLNSGANYLRYQLYSDPARTVVWGSEVDGYGGGVAVTFNTTAPAASRTIYARVLAGQQSVPGGSYTDPVSTRNIAVTNPSTGCPQTPGTTTNASYTVTATITQSCIVSAGNLSFGTRGTLGSAVDSTSTITLRCGGGVAWRVALSGGAEANTAARKMASGANKIDYALYKDAGRSQNWGATTGDDQTGTGTGADQNLTVYGRVPIQTTPPAGAYSDTIVVTVTY